MCLIVFAVNEHPDFKLIVAANRDEFYARPTEPAKYWNDNSTLGGRDVQAGGTWMATNSEGKFAAVTNYRDLKNLRDDARSRGELPVDYLNGSIDAEQYLSQVNERGAEYNGFNLLLYDGESVYHLSNYEGKINKLKKGIYAVSNALLDTPWPKVVRLKDNFRSTIDKGFNKENLFELLSNKSLAEDEDLPDTGVGYDLEKMLSAICIRSEKYGTCCSTVLTISNAGKVEYSERSFPVGDRKAGTLSYDFQI